MDIQKIFIDETFYESDLINHKGEKYPKILIQDNEIVKPSLAPKHLADDVFVENQKSFSKRLFNQFRSKGFVSMLNFIKETYLNTVNNDSAGPRKNYGLTILYVLAITILYIRFLYLTCHFYFYPFDKYSDDELLREFNPNPFWESGVIRLFAWHPNSLRCALGLINDLIYVYISDNRRPQTHIVCLKNVNQKRITALCWHPKRDDQLAVACQNKILIWSFQLTNIHGTTLKPVEQCQNLQIIDSLIKSPITSITFDNDGRRLLACSPRNSSISLIYLNDNQQTQVELIRKPFVLCQFTSLLWSPCRTRVFAQTTSPKNIYIFETISWSYKLWKMPEMALCQTSCWSRPSGRILLFVPKESSKIYALTFYDRAEAGDVGGGSSDQSILILDAKHLQLFPDDYQNEIHQICWDSKSTRLAVSFKHQLETIAVYDTKLNPGLIIRPLFVLKSGFQNYRSIANCVLLQFHDNYADPGSLLTLCWSNGYLTHIIMPSSFSDQKYSSSSSTTTTIQQKSPNKNEISIRSLTSLCYSFDESILNNSIQNQTMNGSIRMANTSINHHQESPMKNGHGHNANRSTMLKTPLNMRKISATSTPISTSINSPNGTSSFNGSTNHKATNLLSPSRRTTRLYSVKSD